MDNFAWYLLNDDQELVAFQDKDSKEVTVIDEDVALAKVVTLIREALEDYEKLPFQAQVNALAQLTYMYRSIRTRGIEPQQKKSSILKSDGTNY